MRELHGLAMICVFVCMLMGAAKAESRYECTSVQAMAEVQVDPSMIVTVARNPKRIDNRGRESVPNVGF